VAVSLLDFLYDTNEDFAEKAYTLIKNWRVGITSCACETDLVIYTMYSKFLSTDLTDYGYTDDDIISVMNSIINIFNITNVVINEGDTITYITNTTTNIVYNTTIVYEAPSYSGVYSGVDEFTVTVNHNLNKTNPTVIVTDTATGSRIRVEVGITETDANILVLSFSSTSSGDYKIM
jgi:hypothetical protein